MQQPRLAACQKSLAEFRRRSGEIIANRFSGDTPQGGLSCPCGAIHLLCVAKNTSRPANVRIVRYQRTMSALQQAAAFSKKWLCHFFDSLALPYGEGAPEGGGRGLPSPMGRVVERSETGRGPSDRAKNWGCCIIHF